MTDPTPAALRALATALLWDANSDRVTPERIERDQRQAAAALESAAAAQERLTREREQLGFELESIALVVHSVLGTVQKINYGTSGLPDYYQMSDHQRERLAQAQQRARAALAAQQPGGGGE